MATCGLSYRAPHDHTPPLIQCYAKNDLPVKFEGTVTVERVNLMSGAVSVLDNQQVVMDAGAGTSLWWTINVTVNAAQEVLRVTVVASSEPSQNLSTPVARGANSSLLCDNTILFGPPVALHLPAAHVTFSNGSSRSPDSGSLTSVPILVHTNTTALFVTLTSSAHGRFSDNAFLLLASQSPVLIHFIPFSGVVDTTTVEALWSSLRVEHAQMYQ